MRLVYDKDADAAYLYIREGIAEGEVKKTVQVNKNMVLDFDGNNRLVGIEVLNASKVMPKSITSSAA